MKKGSKKGLMALVVTLAMILAWMPITALAADYIDADGNPATTTGTVTSITGGTTELTTGWYIVDSDVEMYVTLPASGDVHLILADGYTLTIYGWDAGIDVSSGSSLTIYGQAGGSGTLNAYGRYTGLSGHNGAGIGGGAYTGGGDITINGGTITAKSYGSGAGIGGGNSGDGGNVTINGGTVTATGGDNGAGIGGGHNGAGGNIAINGGTITVTGGDNGAGIGGGLSGDGGSIQINDGWIDAAGSSGTYCGGAGIGGGYNGDGGTITIDGGTVYATGSDYYGGAGIGGGGGSGSDGGVITITGGTITATGGYSSYYSGAGIGGGNGGAIQIEGGTTHGTGGSYAAGIGGGRERGGGTVSISGGIVYAQKGSGAPYDIGDGHSGSGGLLSISGTADVFLRTDTCVVPTTGHRHETITSVTDDKVYGVPANGWVPTFGIYMALFTLEYNENGGMGTVPDPVTQHINTTTTVDDGSLLSRDTFTFLGWSTDQDGNVAEYGAGDTFTFTADTVLYVVWEPTHVTSVTIGGGADTMLVGETLPLTATVLPVDASYPNVVWASSDEDVATVDPTGVVSGLLPGCTTITGTADGITDTYKVTVNPSADGSYDIGKYGGDSVITISTGLEVELTNTTAAAFTDMRIVCNTGVTLTLNGVKIDNSLYVDTCPLSFAGSNNELKLTGNSSLKAGENEPGIKVESGTSLKISGSGTVTSHGGDGGAGIGGGSGADCGTVTILGGEIIATAGSGGEAVGRGDGGTNKTVSISPPSGVSINVNVGDTAPGALLAGSPFTTSTPYTGADQYFHSIASDLPGPVGGSTGIAGGVFRGTLTDPVTGVSVSGVFRSGTTLSVGSIQMHEPGECPACDAIRAAQEDGDLTSVLRMDISLSRDCEGPYNITIPVGARYEGQTLTILHCVDGILETFTVVVRDGKVTFSVDSLSPFAVYESDDLDDIPLTGDSGSDIIWRLLCGLSAVGMAVLAVLGKKRKVLSSKGLL